MVEKKNQSKNASEQTNDDNRLDRRTFLGAAAVAPLSSQIGQSNALSLQMTTGAVTVTTEAELHDAVGKHSDVTLGNNITLTKTLQEDLGSSDLTLDLGTYTLTKGDGVNDRMIDIATTGSLDLTNGTIDCNRDGQNFPTVKSKEVVFSNGGTCTVSDVKLVDNSNYGFAVEDFDEAIFDTVTVDSNPGLLTNSSDAAGLDGIHTFDCATVEVDDPNITAGGDGIAVGANERSAEEVVISGGNVSSPVYGNGVRLHVQSGAAADTTISGVVIDTGISDCDGQGIDIVNESANGNVIEDIALAGTIDGVGGNGVRTYDPVENVVITMSMSNVGANGVNIAAGGRAIGIHTSVDGADVNGIHGEDATEVVVSDSSIKNCGNWPIISKGSSNRWNVVDNIWGGNRFADVSLANDDNNVALNN